MAMILRAGRARTLHSHGRLKPDRLGQRPIDHTPGVIETLGWLLDIRKQRPPAYVLLRARLRGLIPWSLRSNWKVNGPATKWALTRSIRRLPKDPLALASIVHGLGEMQARCHADLIEPLATHFHARQLRDPFIARLLTTTLDLSSRAPRALDTRALALAQTLRESTLNWEDYETAYWYMEHPYDIPSSGWYGLTFATQFAVRINPKALSKWIAKTPTQQALSAVVHMASNYLCEDRIRAEDSLLNSGHPLLLQMAAASLSGVGDDRHPTKQYREVHRFLVKRGVAAGDAIWLASRRLKDTIHTRHRLRDRLKASTQNLRFLRTHPAQAPGGEENAAHEIKNLESEIQKHVAAGTDCDATLEDILTDMASCWPEGGLTDDQMSSLEPIFVDTPEFRHRLAIKLLQSNDRQKLLKKNIAQIARLIGLDADPAHFFDDYFNISIAADRYRQIALWSARSIIDLYEQDKKGAGHRAGQLISPLAKSAQALIEEPFVAVRRPSQWESAVARSIAADIFSLTIVAETPEDRQNSVEKLRTCALEDAFKVLNLAGDRLAGRHLIDEFVSIAIDLCGPEYLLSWADCADLPPLIRAWALWANPKNALANLDFARDLFLKASMPPVSPRVEIHHFEKLASMLDSIMVAAAKVDATQAIAELQGLWNVAIADWPGYQERWSDTASKIARALLSAGPDRDFILADGAFQKSATKAWLLSAAKI